MAKYAVIRIKGSQYRVSPDEEFSIDKFDGTPEPEVLLVADGDKVKVGTPTVPKAKVALTVVEPLIKGEKIHVRTFKAKARIRKHIGSRALLTRVKVKSITL